VRFYVRDHRAEWDGEAEFRLHAGLGVVPRWLPEQQSVHVISIPVIYDASCEVNKATV